MSCVRLPGDSEVATLRRRCVAGLRRASTRLRKAAWRFQGCVALPVLGRAGLRDKITPQNQRQVRWPPFLDMAQLLQMLASQQHVLNF